MATRIYNCSDVNMLVTSHTITKSLALNIDELSAIRTNWNAPYAADLENRIMLAISNDLGLDPKKLLRNTTEEVNAIQKNALSDLSILKTQINVDFAKDEAKRSEILRTLGITKYLTKASRNNHEALIGLLKQFSQNLTDADRTALTAKGLKAELLDRIIGYATPFIEMELTQESLKETTKEVPATTIDKFNELYLEIMGICKIAAKFYINNPEKKGQFTFSKVVKKLSNTATVQTTTETSTAKATTTA